MFGGDRVIWVNLLDICYVSQVMEMKKCNFMETFTGMLVFCDKIKSITVISNLVCLPLKSLTKFAQARIPGLWPATLFTLKRVLSRSLAIIYRTFTRLLICVLIKVFRVFRFLFSSG